MRPQREVEVLITSEILHSPDEKLWKKLVEQGTVRNILNIFNVNASFKLDRLNYDQDICLGELIRNCCVNLGFR